MDSRSLYASSLVVFIVILLFSCKTTKTEKSSVLVTNTQHEDFESWKQERIDGLKSPFGWLSLTGLYWLKKDSLSIGTKSGFDINLSYDASANLGSLQKKNDSWFFLPAKDNLVKVNDAFLNAETELLDDMTGTPTQVNYNSLFWYLIKRDDNYGVRLKDTLNKARMELNHIPIFDFNTSLVKQAEVKWASIQDSILITNAQGLVISTPLKGWLEFVHNGQALSLAATNGGKDTWFIVFGDQTNSAETYGAGRFLYVPVTPDANTTTLDFNRAENPPCYYTSFATCPLPPKENQLPIEIKAGEQSEH